MIRISKLTDYGIVLLAHMARKPEQSVFTSRDLSRESGVPLPTVGKLLKLLSQGDFLYSERGVNGGYGLSMAADKISIAKVIELLEGPIGLTVCSTSQVDCGLEHVCPSKSHWQKINEVVYRALSGVTLADMTQPKPVQLLRSGT